MLNYISWLIYPFAISGPLPTTLFGAFDTSFLFNFLKAKPTRKREIGYSLSSSRIAWKFRGIEV